jgi:hypothetical protein
MMNDNLSVQIGFFWEYGKFQNASEIVYGWALDDMIRVEVVFMGFELRQCLLDIKVGKRVCFC